MAIFLSLFFLFLLFLGFAALVLLHFLVTSTAFRRRHRRRQRFPARTHSPELPCESYCGSQEGVMDCAICLEEFKEGIYPRNHKRRQNHRSNTEDQEENDGVEVDRG
ncbi:hypothetical protein K7X08_022343 [Anisodus acutangulus]|uniref:C2H2-type domain-containing protein n=1 Tax=Anisodus acutangulus TaxID=402998 RepID=A0A9Q1MHT0_9SOLA|nr:hypothetical protein K7X08_022343 [Anisodus acutangulus]